VHEADKPDLVSGKICGVADEMLEMRPSQLLSISNV
jgi:hypothetical protein